MDDTAVTAELESYVLQAEVGAIDRRGSYYARKELFLKGRNGETPRLRKDQINRIIIYPGCFNPPHRDHWKLLSHAFLCTDEKTIASMIVPASVKTCWKKQGRDSEKFVLDNTQRMKLWSDTFVQRWAWIFPGHVSERHEFVDNIKRLTSRDGFKIEFVTLAGSDWAKEYAGYEGWHWGDGSMITSDLTRPALMLRDNLDGSRSNRPHTLPGTSSWRSSPRCRATNVPERLQCLAGCDPCWACIKLKALYPEYGDVTKSSNLKDYFDEHLSKLLIQCHTGGDRIWICHRRTHPSRFLIFLPTGLTGKASSYLDSVSSTDVRNVLLEGPEGQLVDGSADSGKQMKRRPAYIKLQRKVLNPELLIEYEGLDEDDVWPFARLVEPPWCFPNQSWAEWDWSFVDSAANIKASDWNHPDRQNASEIIEITASYPG